MRTRRSKRHVRAGLWRNYTTRVPGWGGAFSSKGNLRPCRPSLTLLDFTREHAATRTLQPKSGRTAREVDIKKWIQRAQRARTALLGAIRTALIWVGIQEFSTRGRHPDLAPGTLHGTKKRAPQRLQYKQIKTETRTQNPNTHTHTDTHTHTRAQSLPLTAEVGWERAEWTRGRCCNYEQGNLTARKSGQDNAQPATDVP